MPSSSPAILSSADPAAVARVCAAHHLTEAEFAALRTRAAAAKAAAYCPYSHFRVGAVLLTRDGGFVAGANVENASYPVSTCAERTALCKAVTEGHRGGFRAVAVATDVESPASPCGMCRQCIREFCDLDTPILMFDKNENFVVMKLEELLPLSFGPEHLGVPTAT